jgi:hypothetical protein
MLLAGAAAVRFCAAQNSLWVDEILSVDLVRRLSSPLDVFHKVHSDNNHYLNSLCIYLLGFRGDWPGYRIPSVLAGIGAVAVAGLIGKRRSTACAFVSLILFGFSYVLVLYSSEARGYAALVFFSLLSFLLLGSYLDSRKRAAALAFSLCACLGFLAHLSFVFFFLASVPWVALRLMRRRAGMGEFLESFALCYSLPALLVALLYFLDIRFLFTPGGAHPGLFNTFRAAMAWTLGMPFASTVGPMFAVAILVLAAGLWRLWREGSDLVAFFPGMIVVVPLLLLFLGHQEVLYVRFFIVPMAFLLVLLGIVLSRLWETRGWIGRLICGVFLALYLAANGAPYLSLLIFGRGNNAEAVQYLVKNARESPVTVTGDSDFRIGIVVNFFAMTSARGSMLAYFRTNAPPEYGAEWVIREKEPFEDPVPPAMLLRDRLGHQYRLAAIFRTAPLSGLHWFIYHKEDGPGWPVHP